MIRIAQPIIGPDEEAAVLRALRSGQLAQGRLVAEFEPYAAGALPVFETADAYYAPFDGFARVERPGPQVRIYEFLPDARRGGGMPRL